MLLNQMQRVSRVCEMLEADGIEISEVRDTDEKGVGLVIQLASMTDDQLTEHLEVFEDVARYFALDKEEKGDSGLEVTVKVN